MVKTMMKTKLNKMGQKKVGAVMHEFGKGELHSGKGGKVVKDQKQALAIAISSAAKKMGRMK
jgi:ribosomal protein L21E